MKKLLLIISSVLLLLISEVGFVQPAKAIGPADIQGKRFCSFESASHVTCKIANTLTSQAFDALNSAIGSAVGAVLPIANDISKFNSSNAQQITGEINNIYDYEAPGLWSVEEFYYNPVASKAAKKPVFGDATNSGSSITLTGNLNTATTTQGQGTLIMAHPDKGTQRDSNADFCGMTFQDKDCAINSAQDKGKFDGQDPLDTKPFLEQLNLAQQDAEQYKTCESNTLVGPVSSYICPTLFFIKNAFQKLIAPEFGVTVLSQFLQIKGVKAGSPLQSINTGLLFIADTIFILIFLVIIFANTFSLGIDNYTIKRTLPRLIAGIILAQFSYFICALLVDLSNVIGNFMYDLIYGLAGIPNQGLFVEFAKPLNTLFNAPGWNDFFSGTILIIGIILGGLLFLAGIIAFFVGFVTFLARFLLIYVLIIIAPLAFVAWVLPGTEKYFKIWWTNYIKLLIMYPMVMLIFATAGVVSDVLIKSIQTLPDQSSAAVTTQYLLAALLPIMALFMVPKTFKWGGNLMNAVGGAIGTYIGAKAGTAKGVGKSVAKTAHGGLQDKALESKFGDNKAVKAFAGGGAGAFLGTRGSERKINARTSRLRGERESEAAVAFGRYKAALAPIEDEKFRLKQAGITDPTDARLVDLDTRQKAAVAKLVATTKGSKSAQFALMKSAAIAGDADVLSSLRGGMDRDAWVEGVSANYPAFDKVPLERFYTTDEATAEAGKFNTNTFLDMSQGAQKSAAESIPSAIPAEVYTSATAEQRTKFATGNLAEMGKYAYTVDASDTPEIVAHKAAIQTVLTADGKWQGTASGASGPAPATGGGGSTGGGTTYVPPFTPGGGSGGGAGAGSPTGGSPFGGGGSSTGGNYFYTPPTPGPAGPAGAAGAGGSGGTGGAGGSGGTGTPGPAGPAGTPGATGASGPGGTSGTPGTPGAPGPAGTPGVPGSTGTRGPRGTTPGAPPFLGGTSGGGNYHYTPPPAGGTRPPGSRPTFGQRFGNTDDEDE